MRGQAFIGCLFDELKTIRKITIRQLGGIPRAILETTMDGETWNPVYRIHLIADQNIRPIHLPGSHTAIGWRLVPDLPASSNGPWSVFELQMFE